MQCNETMDLAEMSSDKHLHSKYIQLHCIQITQYHAIIHTNSNLTVLFFLIEYYESYFIRKKRKTKTKTNKITMTNLFFKCFNCVLINTFHFNAIYQQNNELL